ncbi:alpha-1,3-mannosyl-glycoprotein 4-beta-N-acetylglucosaminyltransferase B-like isoform X2 [Rhopilema esculentum]|uniref:alpha-1,3-mannosyl-glycoprotein 4-beta-N-acetylglucosaminyltransferase B-like isoform X2 n=1 Tax=Rhopilema esculentum TaxID=499914 RepID=UPI0031D7128F
MTYRKCKVFAIIISIPFFMLLFLDDSVLLMPRKKLEAWQLILETKVDELKRKLNEVEYTSTSISRELVSLNSVVQKTLPSNKTTNILSLPSIYGFLPHLVAQPNGLVPNIHIGTKTRRKVSLAFGIPSIYREQQSYLSGTLRSLINGLTDDDRSEIVLIVFIGDAPSVAKKRVEKLSKAFSDAVSEGILEFIVPNQEFYPDMKNLPLTFNDSPDRVRWRTKQNLDYSFMMMYAQNKARFYCQLEDDIVATPAYASTILTFALQQENNDWFMLEFSSLGFIGKLFKSSDLSVMVDFFLMFYKDKPVDWLLDHILWVKVCNPEKDGKHCNLQKQRLKIRFKPSLFQHVGKVSSLKGKRQALVDKDFKNEPMFQAHLNPKAIVKTSFETYQRYTAEAAYLGQTFFWALTPHAGEVLRFCFKKPTIVDRFKFKTGMVDHPGDLLVNATVEVLTQAQKEKADSLKKQVTAAEISNLQDKESYIQNEYNRDIYIEVGRFSANGLAANKVPDNIGAIAELRIRVVDHKNENWVALSEIHIVEKKQR